MRLMLVNDSWTRTKVVYIEINGRIALVKWMAEDEDRPSHHRSDRSTVLILFKIYFRRGGTMITGSFSYVGLVYLAKISRASVG